MRRYFRKLPFPFYFLIVGVVTISVILGFQAVFSANYMSRYGSRSFEENLFTFLVQAINFIFWAVLSPIIYTITTKTEFLKRTFLKDLFMVLFFGIALATIHELITASVYYSIVGMIFKDGWSFMTFGYLSSAISTRFLEFIGIFIFFTAFDFYKKYSDSKLQIEKISNQLNEAQLKALKMQLHPHFLFNTLNAISSMIDEDSEKAQDMISQLGELFRKVLKQGKVTEVTLDAEMEFIRNYLQIEQIRFNDRLVVNIDIQENTKPTKVPNLILQPLVENAIKHGFQKHADACEIKISSKVENDYVRISVEDNGAGSPNFNPTLVKGMGLRIVKERLAQFYRNDFRLEFFSAPNQGFKSLIFVPLRT